MCEVRQLNWVVELLAVLSLLLGFFLPEKSNQFFLHITRKAQISLLRIVKLGFWLGGKYFDSIFSCIRSRSGYIERFKRQSVFAIWAVAVKMNIAVCVVERSSGVLQPSLPIEILKFFCYFSSPPCCLHVPLCQTIASYLWKMYLPTPLHK